MPQMPKFYFISDQKFVLFYKHCKVGAAKKLTAVFLWTLALTCTAQFYLLFYVLRTHTDRFLFSLVSPFSTTCGNALGTQDKKKTIDIL